MNGNGNSSHPSKDEKDPSASSSSPSTSPPSPPLPTLPVISFGFAISRWGELIDSKTINKTTVPLTDEQFATDRERERKWIKMLRNWDKYKDSAKLKRRVRKGIPDSVRAAVWAKFIGMSEAMESKPTGYFRSLLSQSSPDEHTMLVDIGRTFPGHVLFRTEGANVGHYEDEKIPDDEDSHLNPLSSPGRAALFNVMKATAVHDKATGYCQGMGFMIGIFLMYFTEEESFWMINGVLRGDAYQQAGIFMPGFPLLFQYLYVFDELIKSRMGKLHKHLTSICVTPPTYALKWFMTVFAYKLSFDFTLRIYDIFFHEGPKITFKFALYFLQKIEAKLLKCDIEGAMAIFDSLEKQPEFENLDECVEAAMEISLSKDEISRLGQKYQQQQLDQQNTKGKGGKTKK